MPEPAVKITEGKQKMNLHLSDKICMLCGGHLPKEEDMHILQKDHGHCMMKMFRIMLSGDIQAMKEITDKALARTANPKKSS